MPRTALLLATLALLVSGCSADTPDPAPADVAAPAALPAEPVVLAEGTFKWHDYEATQPFGAFQTVYNPVTQVAAHPCIFDGSPYFSNRHLPTAVRAVAAGNGTLAATMSWGGMDYTGTQLFLAYRAPGSEAYKVTDGIANGGTASRRVEAGAGTWDLWLCVSGEESNGDAVVAVPGSITVLVTFTPE